MRKAEASAPELKLSSSGFRGSRFPQATHLIFFFRLQDLVSLYRPTLKEWTLSLSPFSQPPVAASPVLQEKLLGRLLILVGVIQLRFWWQAATPPKFLKPPLATQFMSAKSPLLHLAKPPFSSNFPKPSVLQVQVQGHRRPWCASPLQSFEGDALAFSFLLLFELHPHFPPQVWQLDSARWHSVLPKATTLLNSAPAWRRIRRIWVLIDFTAVSARPLLRGSSPGVRVRWIPLTAPLFEVPLKFMPLVTMYVPHMIPISSQSQEHVHGDTCDLFGLLWKHRSSKAKNSGFKLFGFFALALLFLLTFFLNIFFFFYLTLLGPFLFYGFFFFVVEDALDCRFRFLIFNWYRSFFFFFLCIEVWCSFFKFPNFFFF